MSFLDEQREQGKKDLAQFASLLGYPPADHHIEWFEYLEDKSLQRIVNLAPRESAKSTEHSVIYPLWEMVNDESVRIVLVSDTATQAQSFLRQTTDIIERHEDFITVFGNLRPDHPDKWTENEIIINRPAVNKEGRAEKDPTISATGAGGPILSKRADLIICDDILNKENTRTHEQRKKLREWFWEVLMPVLVKGGRLIWIATAWNTEDLSHELLKNPMFDIKRKSKSVIKDAERQDLWEKYREILFSDLNNGKRLANEFYAKQEIEMNRGAVVLWPGGKSYKDLMDIKLERGLRAFNLSYQNEALSEETAIFKEEWIEACKDVNRRLVYSYDVSQDTIGIKNITQGVDLAVSEEDTADDTVDLSLGRTSTKYIIMNCEIGKFSPANIRRTIIAQDQRFNPSIVLVEDNAFQASLQKDMAEMSVVPIRGFTTTGEKYDEFIGINSLAVIVENKQLVIPADPTDPRTVEFYQRLKEEMLSFPSGHTGDVLIALWFAFTGMRGLSSSQVTTAKSGGLRKAVTMS